MKNREMAEKLLSSFSVLHYFFRHHRHNKKEKPVLKIEHFSYLWLIDKLQKDGNEKKEAKRNVAGDITYWRRKPVESKPTTKKTLFRIVEELKTAELIKESNCLNTGHIHDGRSEVLETTSKGLKKLKVLEDERISDIEAVLIQLESALTELGYNIDCEKFIEIIEKLSLNVWEHIKSESISKPKKSRDQK